MTARFFCGLDRAATGAARPMRRTPVPRPASFVVVTQLALAIMLSVAARPSVAELTIATWNIAWLRNTPLAHNDYEYCKRMRSTERNALDDRHPMRWVCRRADHYDELAQIARRVNADIFAFQEVEGVEALRRILPADEYDFFVTDSPWIQRVAFAVRRARVRVSGFNTYRPLGASMAERPRFGADLTVNADGKTLRLLAVHLKSACHSRPLTDESRGPRDDPRDPPACPQLAQQVAPLEQWIDARVREKVDFIVLGDFNRRFDAPAETTQPARDAKGRPLSIWQAINDDDPPGARLVRLTAGRKQARACWGGDPKLAPEERSMYIDHIIVNEGLAARIVERSLWQWPLQDGKRTRDDRNRQRELSDHCPLSMRMRTS
jgi:endonuclease/exonuclease/phosphatase family metal-dependent hydrolase